MRILVVDDEELIRFSFLRPLQKEGYAVEAAENGKTAMDKIENGRYDLAIVDLQLGDIDGLDVMRRLKETSPDTKVVVITGFGTPETKEKVFREGASGCYDKPFDTYEVVRCVKECLSGQRQGAWPERRQSERNPYNDIVEFMIEVPGSGGMLGLSGKGVNISTGGICISTGYRLSPGSMVKFVNGLGDKAGVVQWSKLDGDDSCMAGIKFVPR